MSYQGNPYHILDGQWGGLGGMQTWFRFSAFGSNVFEACLRERRWVRIWDSGVGAWREPVAAELEVPFPYGEPAAVGNFDQLTVPMIAKAVAPNFKLSDIVAAQPMSADCPTIPLIVASDHGSAA